MDFRQELKAILQQRTYVFDRDLLPYSEKLFSHCKEIPPLYRYVPANCYSINSILTQTIYLSEVGKMNDVFEGLNTYVDIDTVDELSDLSDIVYMKSFSETKDNLVMWGSYAENYTGLCIEYDLRNMQREYYYHLFPVCYDSAKFKMKNSLKFVADELRKYKKEGLSDDTSFLSDIVPLYLQKSSHWDREKEWRILVSYLQMHETWSENGVVYDDENEYQFAINNQTIPFPYISKVYIGPKASEATKECVFFACKNADIPASLTSISESYYCLEELPMD